MAKFLLGLITGVVLCVFFVVIVIAAAATFSGRGAAVADGSTLVLDLSGEILERNPVTVSSVLAPAASRPTLMEVRDLLKKAAVDRRVNGVVVKLNGLRAGWGKAEEIRAGLEEFRKSNKPLVAFLQVAGMRDYYIASAADRIYAAPEGLLDVKGLRAEVMFFKNTLGKLGIVADMEHVGKYKSFSEPFTRDRMSEEYREVTNSILDVVLGQFLAKVAPARRMKPEDLRAALDRGPFLPAEARRAGLADDLLYEDQVFEEVRKRAQAKSFQRLKPQDYSRISLESLGLAGGSRIALVYAVGDIWRGEDDLEDDIGSDSLSRVLREVGEDRSIQGVIVRIDSPGGDSIASDQLWREMNRLSRKKPMVVSLSDVAASGGYYMAMSGDPVVAYPGTFTGSIGVVFGKVNLKGLYDKVGITKEILSRGKFAEIDTDYRSFTPAERAKVLQAIEQVYRAFVAKVAESRKRPAEEIDALAQGRVWLGSQARDNGLVDELGGLDRAVELVKQRARLNKEDKVTLVAYPPQKKLLDLILTRLGAVSGDDPVVAGIRRKLRLLNGGLLKMSHYSITVQ